MIVKTLKRIGIAGALCATVLLATLFWPLPDQGFRKEIVHSLRVLDRNGLLLREFLNDQQGRGQWRTLDQIALSARSATVAIEDKRFYHHIGIDPLAMARAVVDDARAMRFVSGGSTISQQVIRNIYHYPRSIGSKAKEAWLALRLERMMSKDAILEQYLNRAPYGNQVVGIEAAAHQYFGKSALSLSIAEGAFLAALPNAPSLLNPYRNLDAELARQRLVLRRMREQGFISADEYQRGLEQPLVISSSEVTFRAPHVVEMVAARFGRFSDVAVVQTFIDYPLQKEIQHMLKAHLMLLAGKNVTNGSVVVIDNATGEVRALVGSADYFDEVHEGQVNGATALRQPGSAIKPFTYGLALEAGYSPATVLADISVHIPDDRGDYIPENYDKRYHGPVRLRTALACSYNIPAVRTLQYVGRENLLERLRLAGLSSIVHPADYYGYGLTLGNAEVSLLELTNAYAALANGGLWKPARLTSHAVDGNVRSIDIEPCEAPHRVFDERVAFLLADILSDPVARRPGFGNAFHFPFPCAVKTGTTKDYRDNWTMGFTTAYTVGVWVGNFDGSEMRGVSGVTGAGQIFVDIMMLLHMPPQGQAPVQFIPPDGLVRVPVCPRSGRLPTADCGKSIDEWFIRGNQPADSCTMHQRLRFPDMEGRSVERVYEVLPAEFSEWASQQQMPVPPAGARKVIPATRQRARRERGEKLCILSPNDGDEFKLDPTLRVEYQTLRLVGSIPPGLRDIRVIVDDDETIRYEERCAWWPLKKGSHRLQLVGIGQSHHVTSEPITIHVE